VRAEAPLLASLAASTLLIPTLLMVQRRLPLRRSLSAEDAALAAGAPLAEPEAA
jgi:hypothetical protein